MRKILTQAGVASSAVAVTLLLASPAVAATSTSDFTVDFTDQRPTTTYYVENAAAVSQQMTGKTVVYWQILDDQVIDGSTRFSRFKVQTRIEERVSRTTEDHVVTSRTCDLTELVNDHYSWSTDDPANQCVAPPTGYDSELYWSSDSTITYDIVGDDKGVITEEMQGSPLLHG